MLQPNALYALVKNKLHTPNQNFEEARIEFKKDRDDHDYILYNLPHPQEISVDTKSTRYTLANHHLSFYAQQDDSKPWLSQYHYTAILKNKENKSFRLHVYFNQKDELADMSLAPDNATENHEAPSGKMAIDDELRAEFLQLAKQNSKNCVSDLRQQAQLAYEKQESRYESLEIQLATLSESFQTNKNEYSEKLKEIMKVLQLLIAHHQQYQNLHKLFSRIQFSLQNQNNIIQKSSAPVTEMIATPSTESAPSIVQTEETPTTSLPLEMLESIKAARTAYKCGKEEKVSLIEQANLAQQFVQVSLDTLLIMEEKETPFALQDLIAIQRAASEATREAKSLLVIILLSKKNMEAAAKLANFTHQLSPKFLLQALRKNDHELLDFLLTHGRFAIDTVMIEGVSPVLYCLKNHSNTNSKEKCLSVLIKHNASLFVEEPDGLPVAHHILADKQNTLANALLDHSDKTTHQPRFYAMLAKAVEAHLKRTSLDQNAKRIMQDYVAAYQKATQDINMFPLIKRTGEVLNSIANSTASILSRINDAKERPFLENPEYLKRAEKIKALNRKLTAMIKAGKKSRLKVIGEDKSFTEMLEIPQSSASQETQERYLRYQDSYIQQLDASIEQDLLSKLPGTKHNIQRHTELSNIINNAQQEMVALINESKGIPRITIESYIKTKEEARNCIHNGLNIIKSFDPIIKGSKNKLTYAIKEMEQKEIDEHIAEMSPAEAKDIAIWITRVSDIHDIKFNKSSLNISLLSRLDILDIAMIDCHSGIDQLIKMVNLYGVSYEVTYERVKDKVLYEAEGTTGFALNFEEYVAKESTKKMENRI